MVHCYYYYCWFLLTKSVHERDVDAGLHTFLVLIYRTNQTAPLIPAEDVIHPESYGFRMPIYDYFKGGKMLAIILEQQLQGQQQQQQQQQEQD